MRDLKFWGPSPPRRPSARELEAWATSEECQWVLYRLEELMMESARRLSSSEPSQPPLVAREQGIWSGLEQAIDVIESLQEREDER